MRDDDQYNCGLWKSYFPWRSLKLCGHRLALNNKFYADKQYPVPIFINTVNAKNYIHILGDVIYVLFSKLN